MTISTSVGFSKKLLTGTTSAKELFTKGVIKVFSGTVPENASAATGSAVVEWTITTTETPPGLVFEDGVTGSRSLVKKADVVWGGVIPTQSHAPATFFRLLESGDAGTAVDTDGAYARIQGTVGVAGSGADFLVSNTTFVSGATKNLSQFVLSIPE